MVQRKGQCAVLGIKNSSLAVIGTPINMVNKSTGCSLIGSEKGNTVLFAKTNGLAAIDISGTPDAVLRDVEITKIPF